MISKWGKKEGGSEERRGGGWLKKIWNNHINETEPSIKVTKDRVCDGKKYTLITGVCHVGIKGPH